MLKEAQDKVKLLYSKYKRAAARRRWRFVRVAIMLAGTFKSKTKRISTDADCAGVGRVTSEIELPVQTVITTSNFLLSQKLTIPRM